MNRILKLAQWISISTFILTKMLLKWLFNRWGKKETSNFKNQFLSWWNLWYSLTFYVKVGFPCCYGIPLSFGTTSNIFLFVFTMKPFFIFYYSLLLDSLLSCYLWFFNTLYHGYPRFLMGLTPRHVVFLLFWMAWIPCTVLILLCLMGWIPCTFVILLCLMGWTPYTAVILLCLM